MRILVDARHLARPNPSGVGGYTTNLLRALFKIDKENEYVLLTTGRQTTPNPSFIDLTRRGIGVEHVHVSTPNKLLNARFIASKSPTIDQLVDGLVDLIFLPSINITPLPESIPTVLTVHDLSFKHFPKFYSARMGAWHKACRVDDLFARADHIITPSESTKRDLNLPNKPITTIPHGVDPIFAPKMVAQDHGVRGRLKLPKRFVLFVGTLEPRKNLIALVNAVKEYRLETREDLHLVLAGKWGWKTRALKKRLWKRDAKGWVHHLGYVDDTHLPALYRSAEALVWPSIYEGFGLPVLEAMACGTPVITTSTSSLPEVTESAAIHVDPYNSRDVTEALKQLLHSNELKRRLSLEGVDRAKTFTWEQSAQATLEVFKTFNKKSNT
jgi:glycosyltransferase involved in cell wall biosynthesis